VRPWLAGLWAEHRWAVIGGLAATACGVGIAAYLLLKPPSDVSNPDAAFEAAEKAAAEGLVDWPLYGLDPARTRFLPTDRVKPPYKVKWRFKAQALVEYSPVVGGGFLYGINNIGTAFRIDPETGKAQWKRQVAELNASAPAYADGRLYISNLEPGQVQALDAETGRSVWRHPLPGRSESSPVVVGDKVVMGCECGTLFALDKDTGRTIWETDLGGEIKGAPALSEGILYIGAYGGTVSAIRLNDGSVKWQANAQSAALGGAGNFYATPTVAFDRVYVGNTDGRMYSFEKQTGKIAWTKSTGDYVYAAAVAADTAKTPPTVYFGSYDGTFYALDARSGKERWSQPGGGAISGAASLIGDVVYIANLAKTRTIGFDAASGKRVFAFRDGAYNPVISDGKRLYITGYQQIYALAPSTATHGAKLQGKKVDEEKPG
jgi:outer membrane protein assembly factor BamB